MPCPAPNSAGSRNTLHLPPYCRLDGAISSRYWCEKRVEIVSLVPPTGHLDDAGIQRGVVISTAYWYGDPRHSFTPAEAEAKTRADNDWTVAQVSKYPDRLVAFCGVSPLADYAAREIARC